MTSIDRIRWEEMSNLLDELLDLDGEQRAERLGHVRSRDPALADELAALLAYEADNKREKFLEGSAVDFAASPEDSLAGKRVGAYTLERPLGQGGMGTVWLARRSDGRFEGTAAIKFLNLALLTRGGPERFQREGNVLARLTHPNIARLFDAGVAEGGQPYLVLEHIEGEPIDRWCDAHALDINARVRLFLDVLGAVGHAHSKLILHRDIKPTNILVTADGQAKLLDFGIAKLVDQAAEPAAASELTQLAGPAFTPDYAAPEQVQGGEVTTATDVYSLGVLLYVLLGGRHPTSTPVATLVDRLRAVIDTEPARLSDVASRTASNEAQARASTPPKLARLLRGDLDNIVAKALKKEPDQRYASATEFSDDLRRYLRHEPVTARADSLGYRASKFVRRYRLAVGAAAMILLVLVAGVIGTTWQALEARRAQAVAEANAEEARTQRSAAEFETRVARANHEFVSQLFGDAMRSAESGLMRARLDRAREMLRRRYRDDPIVHALLLFQLAGRYAELNEDAREADVMREVEQLATRTNEPSLLASIACIKAYELIRDGNTVAAKPLVAEGLGLLNTAIRPQVVASLECYRADAMLAVTTGERSRGVAQMQRLLSQLERDGLEKTRAYTSSLSSLAFIHHLGGDLVSALAVNRRALALDEALGVEATLSSQIDLGREAELLYELGRIAESRATDRELMQRFTTMDSGAAPPVTMLVLPARRAINNGNVPQATSWLLDTIAHFEREGADIPVRNALLDLASAYLVQGRYDDASAMLRRFETRLGTGTPRLRERVEAARIAVGIALETRDRRRIEQQLRELDEALAAAGVARSSILPGLLTAGLGRLENGELDHARAHAARLLQVANDQRLEGQASAWTGAAHWLQARIATVSGDAAAAREALALAAQQFEDTLDAGHPWRVAVEKLARTQ